MPSSNVVADFFVAVSLTRTHAHTHESYRPTFRVPYHGAPRLPATPLPVSLNVHAPALLPVSDACTRQWVAAHAVVASARIPSTYAGSLEEARSVFSDDSDLESASSADSHDDEDEVDGKSSIVKSPSPGPQAESTLVSSLLAVILPSVLVIRKLPSGSPSCG